MKKLLLRLIFFFFLIPFPLFANRPVHSLFSSRLLPEKTFQFDLLPLGGAHLGVTENLELGTSAPLVLFNAPNLFLKHRMFKLGISETSFSSFTLYNLRKSEGVNVRFFSLHGIVSNLDIRDDLAINLGLMRAFILTQETESSGYGDVRTETEYEIYHALAGFEWDFSPKWSARAFLLLPLYLNAELESDISDGNVSSFANLKLGKEFVLGNVSFVRYWTEYQLELGVFQVSKSRVPYVSFSWRLE